MLDTGTRHRVLRVGGSLAIVQAIILSAVAYLDGNLWLPGPAIGLLEHPGIFAVIVADFVVLWMLGYTTRRFLRVPGRLPVLSSNANRRFLRRFTTRGRAAILLQGPSLALFLFCSGVGTLFWLLNAAQTADPIRFYGRDVFDSAFHPASYLTFRAFLWVSWGVIYPYAVVVFLAISGNLYLATRTLLRRGQLTYRPFHPDRCGGFSIVGDISFATIMMLATLYASLAVVIVTHHKINLLQLSGFVLISIALLTLTYLVAWPITRFMWRRRRASQNNSYRRLLNDRDLFAAVQLTWVALATSASPYAPRQRVLINGVRALPLVVAGLRLSAMV
ncbi:MAG TPA: hypothetical protein VF680_13820 [Allosphingosinicella sp.]|jgi:hypothetical protein